MEEIIKEAAEQVPALVIVVVLCFMFLRQQSEARGEYLKSIERFHADNLDARNENRETIHANSEATGKQTAALHELTTEVKELRGSLLAVVRKVMN